MKRESLNEHQLAEFYEMAHPLGTSKASPLFGKNSIYALFGKHEPVSEANLALLAKSNPNADIEEYRYNTAPKTGIPWAMATRLKGSPPYDIPLVQKTVAERPSKENMFEGFDPRFLHGSQPSVVSPGVRHYLEHGLHGPLYADQEKSGNQFPFVYIHRPSGQLRLLAGHHRAAAALLKGTPLMAKYAIGDV